MVDAERVSMSRRLRIADSATKIRNQRNKRRIVFFQYS